jgi:cellulose synthase/poly-beta-1,6-N-acetylglucosamine synthase-like glycosyltransferase
VAATRPKRLFQVLMLTAMAINIIYLAYRIGFTLNFGALTFSLVFLAAEIHGIISLWLYFYEMWSPRPPRTPPPITDVPAIDVFVPTFNEDLAILHRTILAVKEMRLPHETYVLDDGSRDEVKRLAERMGVHYISRPEHVHAKAGNINYALERTSGELVAVFDADHVPMPNFLERTVGYFQDEKLGFVQTPHFFYNLGSFQTSGNFRTRQYNDDQQLFFRVIQPGKDHWGASFFCGSCGIIRRTCLEEAGGFDSRTITEDMHTSLRIHSKGWQSVYHEEHLATGLSPADLGAYWKQRMRWAVGNLSVMWHDNPLVKKGLTLRQRISYFASVWAWTVGPQKVMFYLTPLIMLLTGLFPIANFDMKLLTLYGVHLCFGLWVYKLISAGHARIVRGELYSMINAFMLTMATVRAMFGLGTRTFVVTRKGGRSEQILAYVLPQIGLIFFTYWCGVWAWLRHRYNLALDMTLTTVAGGWAIFNACLALAAARIAYKRIDIRKQYRFRRRLPVVYEIDVPDERKCLRGLGSTMDIHESGLAMRCGERLPESFAIRMEIHIPTGDPIRCTGTILHERPGNVDDGLHEFGILFDALPQEEHEKFDRFITQFVIPATFRFLTTHSPSWRNSIARRFSRGAIKRRFPRSGIQLPLRFGMADAETEGRWHITDDLSGGGMAVSMAERMTVGDEAPFTLMTPTGPFYGEMRVAREEKVVLAGMELYRYGLEFVGMGEDDRKQLARFRRYAIERETKI